MIGPTKTVVWCVYCADLCVSYVEVSTFQRLVKDPRIAYNNWMDSKEGVMVCNENFNEYDENAPADKIYHSDVLWQSWAMVANAAGSDSSALQAIVRYTVVNEPTKEVIWEAARVSSCTKKGPNYHSEYTDKDKGYYAFLGSVNGGSSMRMLLDHKAETGYRTVDRVVVLGDDQLTLKEPRARTVVLLLSPCQNPPGPEILV